MRLKTFLSFLCLLCSSLLLTSCFDFIEDVNLKRDGSGTIKATLNFSKSSTKIASLMKLGTVNGIEIPSKEKIENETAKMISILHETAGISDVKYKLDFNNYIANVSCSFSNIEALNAFSEALAAHFKTSIGEANNYSYSSKLGVFSRAFKAPDHINKKFSKLSEADKKYFDNAYYTQIIRFENTIKSQDNKTAKLSNSLKSTLLKVKFTDLVSKKATLENTITLNK